MSELIRLEDVKNRFVTVRGELSLLAGDVAALYGVEPREVTQAVKNNPAKFPEGYVFDLTKDEVDSLRSKFLIIKKQSGSGHHSKYGYKAFTEKGLYMLATITTQLLHRQAQAHRPPRETGRRGPHMTQTTFYKNWSRPTLCKLWVDGNWRAVSDPSRQLGGCISAKCTDMCPTKVRPSSDTSRNWRGRSRHSACGLGYPLAQALGPRNKFLGGYDLVRQVSNDVMRKVEQNMLQAALVSWVVTHVMDRMLVIVSSSRNLTWEKIMKHLYAMIQPVETLVVNIVCSPAIVVGVCLEWLAHVARAVGVFVNQPHLKSALLPRTAALIFGGR